MASNLRRSKRTVGKRISDLDNKVERLRKANTPTRVGDNVLLDRNLGADISANKITAGTIDAAVVNVTNINATNIKTGTLTSITIQSGTPVGGVYPFRVDTNGNMTSTSGYIGAFTITDTALTATDSYSPGLGETVTTTVSLATAGQIYTKFQYDGLMTNYYTEIFLNKTDEDGCVIVRGTKNGGLETTKIFGSNVSTPLVMVGGSATTIYGTTANFGGLVSATRVRVADGTLAAPSISFTNDTNTGLYSNAANIIGFVTDGALRARIGTNFLDLQGQLGITGATSISTTGDLTVDGKLNGNGPFELDQGGAGSTTAIPSTTTANVGVLCFNGTSSPVANQAVYWRAATLSFSSSIRFKENINTLADTAASLSRFWDLEPIEYEYKDEFGGAIEKERPYNHRRRFGFIAEDVEEKVPYLVSYDDNSAVDAIKADSIVTILYAEVRKMRQYMIDNFAYPG